MEFDIGERTLPPGFDECAPGEAFVKLGVGLLERDSPAPYSFGHAYPVRIRPETTLTLDDTSARFRQRLQAAPDRFGYDLTVDVRLDDTTMTIDYTLENLGSETINTEQYLHNFCCFDGAPLSAAYTVTTSYECEVCDSTGALLAKPLSGPVRQIDSRTFGFDPSAAEDRAKVFVRPVRSEPTQQWSITHSETGTALTVEADQSPPVSAIYVTREQISLEMNVMIGVTPGDTARWSRRYTFQ